MIARAIYFIRKVGFFTKAILAKEPEKKFVRSCDARGSSIWIHDVPAKVAVMCEAVLEGEDLDRDLKKAAKKLQALEAAEWSAQEKEVYGNTNRKHDPKLIAVIQKAKTRRLIP